MHQLLVTVQLEGALLLDGANAALFHVARDDAGEGATQVGCQQLGRLVAVQIQTGHIGVIRLEGELEFRLNLERPVEGVSIADRFAIFANFRHRFFHHPRHFRRIADDDPVEAGSRFTQGRLDEVVDGTEVVRTLFRAGQDDGHRLAFVGRVHHDAEQIEQLFCRTYSAREDDDAVAEAYEGFQSLLDIRQDHQLVDDGVGRLGRNDGGFGQADVTAVAYPLLGVTNCSALHRALHGARATAGTDV